MTAEAERALKDQWRRALDQRLFHLGYQLQTPHFHGHFNGCGVGLVSGAKCRCREIAAGIRASRALRPHC